MTRRSVTVESVLPTPAWQDRAGMAGRFKPPRLRFSEIFRLARTEGRQRITRQGKESVVMISDEQYNRRMIKSRQPKSIVQFFRESPLVGVDFNLDRNQDTGRDLEL